MRIVIGVDGSMPSQVACAMVARRSWPPGTSVRLVAVAEPVAEVTRLLEARAQLLRRARLPSELILEAGRPGEVLVAHAINWLADLVVVGSRGRGAAASALLGSVSAHLVDHAPCPVLVARSVRAERMLLATDGTRSCLDVPRLLANWRPAFHGMEVEVLSIAQPGALSDHRRIATEVADEMVELGWRAAAVTRMGDPSREIVRAAEGYGADLVVTGSRCLGTLERLLAGSVSHAVLVHGHASVLVMRGQVPARVRQPLVANAFSG